MRHRLRLLFRRSPQPKRNMSIQTISDLRYITREELATALRDNEEAKRVTVVDVRDEGKYNCERFACSIVSSHSDMACAMLIDHFPYIGFQRPPLHAFRFYYFNLPVMRLLSLTIACFLIHPTLLPPNHNPYTQTEP